MTFSRPYDLRALLESYAAAGAAKEGTADQVAALRRLAAEMEAMVEQSNPSIDGIAEVNDRFHKALLKACNNPKLSDLLIGLVELPLQLGTFRHYNLGELRRSANQHSELVTAVEAKDGDWARSVMTSHILSARYTLLSAMAGLPVDEDVVP